MNYGFYTSPFGTCCMAYTTEGLFALVFAKTREIALVDLQRRFPDVAFTEESEQVKLLGDKIFKLKEPVGLCPQGTSFQRLVWKALQEIPVGETRTYAQIANAIGKPKAVRAVGTAIGANPIAYLIPCHRVVRADGGLGGYRWGLALKQQMLRAEGVNL
ncbi:MAG: methylated-DNA--[protein]-cysteine S-methyltransferase [Paludibacter sp.]|jgi:AraC family transcriptional regulator of adaptative response/methylated-DNA-[protein]-cysteine methyltransferase|nr:methylated-DNA--[protein]-cysteine S-methyltransferase [Paludibacter sp.]